VATSLDFQRLARVRERRRQSRRRRLVRVVAGLGVAVALLAIGKLVAPMLPGRLLASLLEQHVLWMNADAPPVVGEIEGRVVTVEPGAGIIHVSSGFLGLMSVELVVTSDALIVVGDKEGGFGDLREGGRVRAIYDIGAELLRARRIEVLGHGSRVASPASPR
jgi:hypothetical protein